MKFGSQLYGTATPESDTDYKGIFMPSTKEILLGRIPKCVSNSTKTDASKKNSKEDVDSGYYSLHYFIDLACKGETCALDMLHAPKNALEASSVCWEAIQKERSRFYTRNLNSFVGYARTQAAKYGIKGSRLSDCKRALDFVLSCDQHLRMEDVWDALPMGEHISFSLGHALPYGIPMYFVCGRGIQSTCKLSKAAEILSKYYESYGARAKLAENNEGIDWKAVSHALRAAFQVKEILTTGDLIFPLRDAGYLKQVKAGQLDYKNIVGPRLEKEMEELEELTKKSTLPEKVDRGYWDNFLMEATHESIMNKE
jgi:hypothetical protein